jgi:DNA-binding NarL/FixJ family response regulator
MFMQQRLANILLDLGYATSAILFASTLQAAIELSQQQPISFALVDLGLPDGNGQTFIEALRNQDPVSLILVISAWSTQDALLNAIQAGATGYMLKERDDFEVMLSIRSLLRGGAPIDPFMAQQILSKIMVVPEKNQSTTNENTLLSARELGILQLVASGLSNKAIANQLNLSRHTIECHVKHIYRKLAVSSRSQAIMSAQNLDLLSSR